jgi:transposase
MNAPTPKPPPVGPAAFVGLDWADQKHDVVLRAAATPDKAEHQVLPSTPEAVLDWITQVQQRFGPTAKILVCLEQSRGALLYQLMGYDLFELYPINPAQLANYRQAFAPSGAKSDRPDADLLSELVWCHRDRLKAWKPDDARTRQLAALTEGRRHAVDQRTQLAQELKSQLKVYFPAALQVLDHDTSTALAADLLLQWPTLAALQTVRPAKLRRFFYGHHCRQESKLLERLRLIEEATPLTRDAAVIEPAALRVQLLAQQLKALLPYIARYDRQIAEHFDAHADSFLFRDLPGAGPVLAPRLLTAFGSNRDRFDSAADVASLSGIAPVRRASGKSVTVHLRWACPKFLRQSFHEFAAASIRFCPWAKACYEAQRARGKGYHAAVRAVAFKWIRVLFSCWKHRVVYDPTVYLQALQTRGSAYAHGLTE